MGNVVRSKTTRGEGLVPRGRAGDWQNPPRAPFVRVPPAANVVRSKTTRGEGLVPRWGGGGTWQNPPRQLAVPNHNSGFSSFGVPAPAGMSDWYENDVTRLPSAPANPYIRHSREGGNPRTNIPQKNVNRDTTTYVHAATPLRLSGKTMSRTPIRGWNPEGRGWGM